MMQKTLSQTTTPKPVYETPIVTPLGELAKGQGQGCAAGSTNTGGGGCDAGGSASGGCSAGNILAGLCSMGNTPTGNCMSGTNRK